MIGFPKISCLMVTEGRVELCKKSIHCYIKQTYPYKELIIVARQNIDVIKNYIRQLGRDDIVCVPAHHRLCLGAMRNFSLEVATGEIVCQWDDDDLYHPARLMAQYNALLGGGVVASLYTEHLKLFKEEQNLYWCDWSIEKPQWRTFLCGSIMFKKEMFYRFDNRLYPESGDQSGREEDLNVLLKLTRLGKLAPVKQGHHYIYVFHGNNVYNLEHHKLVLKKRVLDQNQLIEREDLLRRTFVDVGIDHPVHVRSLDSVAWEYEPNAAP